MGRIYASYNDLYNYGKYLDDKSKEFNKISSEMMTLINNIKNSWDGVDSETFIKNSLEYINSLVFVEDCLASFGMYVRSKALRYDSNELKFNEDFNRRGDVNGQ